DFSNVSNDCEQNRQDDDVQQSLGSHRGFSLKNDHLHRLTANSPGAEFSFTAILLPQLVRMLVVTLIPRFRWVDRGGQSNATNWHIQPNNKRIPDRRRSRKRSQQGMLRD